MAPPVSPWMPEADRGLLWSFVDGAPGGLLAVAGDRAIVRANGRWCDMTGYAADHSVGRRIDDLLAAESRLGIERCWRDLLGTGVGTARVVVLRPDGSRLGMRCAFATVLRDVHVGGWLPEPGQAVGLTRSAHARRRGGLSARQQDVLRLLAMGMTTTAAAVQLRISPETARTHLRNAMDRLGAHTRTQAVAVAMHRGEIPPLPLSRFG